MTKDGNLYKLERDEAIILYQQMWEDMQKDLGDNPYSVKRVVYKSNWLKKHGYDDVEGHCFLCEYAQEAWSANYRTRRKCDYCPIDWSLLTCGVFVGKCYGRYKNGGGEVYQCASIPEILALPQRKDEEWVE